MPSITKMLSLSIVTLALATGALLPFAANPASAESLTSESKDRQAEIAAQGGVVSQFDTPAPPGAPGRVLSVAPASVPSECLHTRLDREDCPKPTIGQ